LAWTGVARGLLVLPLVAWLAHAGAASALWAFVIASAASVLIRAATVGATLRSEQLSVLAPLGGEQLELLWRVSLPGLLVSLITVPVNWLGMILLVRSPGGFAQMGVLGAANQWFSMLLFVPGVLSTVTLPLFSQRYAREPRSLQHVLELSVRLSLLAAVPPALLVAAASPWLMSLYGSEFARGWPALALVALAAITSATLNMLLNALGASGRMVQVLSSQLLWALAYLVSTWFLLRQGLGACAVAAAMLIGSLCRLALGFYWTRQLDRC
jgi:O-antigen/teichoic acid export membrane protein